MNPTSATTVHHTGSAVFDGYLLRTRFLRLRYRDDANACSPRAHAHPEHVVFWPSHGTADVEVDGVVQRLALGQGVWVPAGTPHRAGRDETSLVALHIAPAAWESTVGGVRMMTMVSALRELLGYLARTAVSREERLRAQRVCLDLMAAEARPTIELTVPTDERLTRVCQSVLADPADGRTIEDWGFAVALSSRTLARAFRESTGMTFSQWRTCARMALAVELLGQGIPVGSVARDVGFATIGAFSSAFHRTVGRPPRSFHPDHYPDPR